MFTADLSWSGPYTETVGERRERKAREHSLGVGSCRETCSVKTTASSRSSLNGERELWWTAGLKKARSIKPNMLRPNSHRSTDSQKSPFSGRRNSETQLSHNFKDPTLQPSWTYTTTLSPRLPSGAPIDLPLHEVPGLDADTSSRRTNSTEARFSDERRWEVRTPVRVDVIHETSQLEFQCPSPVFSDRTKATSLVTDHRDFTATPISPNAFNQQRHGSYSTPSKSRLPCPVRSERALSIQALKLHDATEEATVVEKVDHPSRKAAQPDARITEWPPLSQWECLSSWGVPEEMYVVSRPPVNHATVTRNSNLNLTRFQRFIRRIERAGPKIVLERLKEDWEEPQGEDADEELALEKQLWLLTGFQIQNFDQLRVTPKPSCDTGRVLELYGNLSEVLQTSAMYPSQTVHFLTAKSKKPITVSDNVSYLTVRECGAVPLPYPEDYFSHIRASTLPSLVPSSKLPELFRECYKLLAPGGILEIRVMDASPIRSTAGPLMRTWIEDRLSVNLERNFRCSKPCSLVPGWLTEAGFDLTRPNCNSDVTMPCAFDNSSIDIDKELSTIIARALWKETWGAFVDEVPGQQKWWWENADIKQECLQKQTMLECRSIFAYKQ
ncbi:hypothetical protein GQ44DRAFT_605107 [Phaeosphaeriaceae sp. PMI808]|nr:hypothetical protein GQ44DRAFT_605107 [Phaeosphaeriaceae sp. PMI808]